MKRLGRLCVIFMLGLSIAIGACKTSPAETASQFYKGKTITIIVGNGPGASYDAYARLTAPYLVKYTGARNVVVQNNAGAGGRTAYNQLYETAKRDGTVVSLAAGYVLVANELLGVEGTRWRATEYNWIGRVGAEPNALVVNAKLPYKSIADLKKAKGLRIAGTAVASSATDLSAGTIEALGLDAKITVGYGGTMEAGLAVMRGEADIVCPSVPTALTLVKNGGVRILAILGPERYSALPEIPTLAEAAPLAGIGKMAYEFRANAYKFTYVMVAPPAVPKERVAFLRQALEKATHDKDMIIKGEKQQRPVQYLSGLQLEEAIRAELKRTPQERASIRHILYEKYF